MKTPYSELMTKLCREIDTLNEECAKIVVADMQPLKIYRMLGKIDGLFMALEMIQPLHDNYIMNNNHVTEAQV